MTEPDLPLPPAAAPAQRGKLPRTFFVMLLIAVLGAGATVFGVVGFFGYSSVAYNTGGMGKTVPKNSRVVYRPVADQEIHRGDLVVFDLSAYPDAVGEEGKLLKRVVAVGGDTIVCCDRSGNIQVNGKPVVESYIDNTMEYYPTAGSAQASSTVPAGTVFVAGDDRSNSRDSRLYVDAPGQGGIPLSKVYGVAIASGTLFNAEALTPTAAFTDAGLPGTSLRDNGYQNSIWLAGGGAVLFLIGFIASIVIAARSAGRRRKAVAALPAH